MKDKKHLIKRNGIWYVRAKIGDNMFCQTTHKTNLDEARQVRDRILDNLFTREGRKKLSIKELEAIGQNALVTINGIDALEEIERRKANKGKKLTAAWGVFEADRERPQCAARQLENHRSNWAKFLEWLEEQHPEIRYLGEISQAIAREWANYRYNNSKAINSYNHHLSSVHFVFEVNCRYDEALSNPFRGIHTKKATDQQRCEPFTEEDLKKLFAYPDLEFQLYCAVGLYTTLRANNVRNIMWADYDGTYLHAEHTKNHKDATILVPDALKYWLDKVPAEKRKGAMFPTIYGLTTGKASEYFKAHLIQLGIQAQIAVPGINGQLRTAKFKCFHSFRCTAETLAARHGADDMSLRRLLGHRTAKMQDHYTHDTPEDGGRAADKIGEFWKRD